MPSDAQEWTVLAHLLRPQGRKGELLADLFTDFPDRFIDAPEVFLAKPDFAGPASETRPVSVAQHWLPVGRNHGRIVLHFAGVDSIEQAETLTGLDVLIPSGQRVELDDDSDYIADLLECAVFDRGRLIGQVTAVNFPTTPDGQRRLAEAAPLLTVTTPQGDEVLIPYVQAFLASRSVENKRLEMNLPDGLIELNAPKPNA